MKPQRPLSVWIRKPRKPTMAISQLKGHPWVYCRTARGMGFSLFCAPWQIPTCLDNLVKRRQKAATSGGGCWTLDYRGRDRPGSCPNRGRDKSSIWKSEKLNELLWLALWLLGLLEKQARCMKREKRLVVLLTLTALSIHFILFQTEILAGVFFICGLVRFLNSECMKVIGAVFI